VVEGLGTCPEKIIFVHKMMSFGCTLPQFLTGSKHGNLGTRILQFNREITKLTKQCKNYSKIYGQTKGEGAVAPSSPSEYATVIVCF